MRTLVRFRGAKAKTRCCNMIYCRGERGRRRGERVPRIKTHRELGVYRMAFEAAMRVFELTKWTTAT